MAHGRGRIIFSDGGIYEGEWEEDQAQGEGVYTNQTRKGRYEGEWRGDLQHGQGKETGLNGAKYEGEYRE